MQFRTVLHLTPRLYKLNMINHIQFIIRMLYAAILLYQYDYSDKSCI